MKYDELRARAIPGPLRPDKQYSLLMFGGYDICDSAGCVATARTKEDAALLAHCYNRFDEALKLLKQAKSVINLTSECQCRRSYYQEDNDECTVCATERELCELIARLEEVDA